VSKTELTPKTISGLTVIQEDVAAESQSAEEPTHESGGETQSDLDAKTDLEPDAKTNEEENPAASGIESQSEAPTLNNLEGGVDQTDQEDPISVDPAQ